MIVTCVTIYVKTEHIEKFMAATIENHNNSIQEPGNLRFDVLQCADDPSRFLLYEVYESEAAAKAHKNTPHYLKWKDTVADWMAKPREGVKHNVIRPVATTMWKGR